MLTPVTKIISMPRLRSLAAIAALPFAAAVGIAAAPAALATTAPANDAFSSPIILSATSGHLMTSNAGATTQPGEPALLGRPAAASIWFTWTPTQSGHAIFRTEGSAVDTVLAAYTGNNVGSLTQLAANDDTSFADQPTHQSRVTFDAVGGTTYRIAVDGYSTATVGAVLLSWTTNDSFSAATTLPSSWNGSQHTLTGSNDGATKEATEPWISQGNPGGHSLWYNWTAPFTGTATVSMSQDAFYPLLGVYTGNSITALTSVASGYDTEQLSFKATAGQLYRIAVDGIDGYHIVPTSTFALSAAEH